MPETSSRRRLIFRSIIVRPRHRQPLIGRSGLGNERIDGRDEPADRSARPVRRRPSSLPQRHRQIPNGDEVVVCFRWKADHVVELQVLDAGVEDEAGAVENLVVHHGLVDDAAKTIRAGFRRDRDGALAALAKKTDDGLGEVVEPQGCRADAIAHLDQTRRESSRSPGGRRARSTPGRCGWRAAGRASAISRMRADENDRTGR